MLLQGRKDRFLRKIIVNVKKNQLEVSKCNLGKNTLAKYPSEIAEMLGKENPKSFTGHCYRRSAATILADDHGSVIELKSAGGWKSSSIAEGYVAESLPSKKRIAAAFSSDLTPTKTAKLINNEEKDEGFNRSIQTDNQTFNFDMRSSSACHVTICLPSKAQPMKPQIEEKNEEPPLTFSQFQIASALATLKTYED